MTKPQGLELIKPDWPAPARVRAAVTTRLGGSSKRPYDSLNLALHVEDDVKAVYRNRKVLAQALAMPESDFLWLQQEHGTRFVDAATSVGSPVADAAYSAKAGKVCTVMTADCLPLLFCDRQAKRVAAVHAGWRGLASGIVAAAVQQFDSRGDMLVWLGPAIGPGHFEVGDDVRGAFLTLDDGYGPAFVPAPVAGKYFADIYGLARHQLALSGVASQQIYGGDECTYSDTQRFYSYRRDGAQSGRMASMVWLAP